jgi:hypothetical protein
MRTLVIGILIVVCLALIAIPALVAAPQPALAPYLERSPFRAPFRFDSPQIWLRWSPFGMHAEGWQGIVSAAASWVYLYLTSVLMLALVPRRVRLITRTLQSAGWRAGLRLFAIGLLAALVSVLLVVLARFTFVWFVLVIVLTGGVFVLSFLGMVGVTLMLGGGLWRWARLAPSLWGELALGSLVLFALGRVPVAGWILVGIAIVWGLGAVLATHLGSGEAWSLQDVQTGV